MAGRSPCTLGVLVSPPLGAWCCPFAAGAALPVVGYLAAGQLVLQEGGAAAKRWGNPAGVPFTRCVDFFAVIGLSTARTGFKVLNKFQCFRAGNCKKTHLNQWLTNMPGV